MNRISKLLFIGMLGITFLLSSCSQYSKLVKAADKAYKEEDYPGATALYKQALNLDSSDLRVINQYAESNRLTWNYKEAEKTYNKVIEMDTKNKFPQSLFFLAMTKKHLGRYAEAMTLFDEYNSKNAQKDGPNNYFIKKSQVEVSACSNAKTFLNKIKDSIEVKTIGEQINSPESDFAPYQFGSNILYYTSYRIDSASLKGDNPSNKKLTKIMKSYLRDSSWSKGQELDYNVFNSTDFNTGNTAFSPDLKRVYFTRCLDISNTKKRCDIYQSKYEDGEWKEAKKLQDPINLIDVTTTHPYVASNGTKGEILFFASDRKGGQGGMDLWYSNITPDGQYEQPVNLGPSINSIDNEATPYYDAINQTLYFSSDWHEGLGGYDLFKSKGFETSWTEPENLGYPFNTSANDNYFHLNQDSKTGYISSNRIGSKVVEGENCCSDIYSFRYKSKEEFEKKEDSTEAIPNPDKMAETTTVKSSVAVRALIPVTLFFHNDEPDAKTEASKTTKNYEDTYKAYKQLEDEYIKMFVNGTQDEAEKKAQEEKVRKFFSENVDKGFNALELFTDLLNENLLNGKQVTITVKGYTSPLNTAEYNKNLAKRRIISLLNYFYTYKSGMFAPYLKGTAASKGFLTFLEDPIGESQSPPNVSDSPKDVINSIYNPMASIERRVEIISISLSLNPEQMDKKIKDSREKIKDAKKTKVDQKKKELDELDKQKNQLIEQKKDSIK